MASRKWLVDTNILSHAIREPGGNVDLRLAALPPDAVCTSILVACELRFGALLKSSPRLTRRIDEVLRWIAVVPLEAEVDRHYADIRVALERAGTPIGSNDLLIAAHARALGLILVTDNTREFLRVPKLRVENWINPPSN